MKWLWTIPRYYQTACTEEEKITSWSRS